jgi:hypothetical protein
MIYRAALVVTASFALSNSDAQPGRGEALVGRWSGETYVSGAMGSVSISFYPNGTYSRKAMSVTEFGWTMDGKTLLLAPAVGRTDSSVTYGKASAIEISFHGDSMIATAKGQSMSLKRVTIPVNEAPVLGRWEGQTAFNETVTQDFTSDGRLIVSVVLSREAGRYDLDDDVINFQEQIPMPGRKRSRFRIEDGKLLLYVSPKLPPLELKKISDS